jgi:D-alanyl-D-alanine dipeptidase
MLALVGVVLALAGGQQPAARVEQRPGIFRIAPLRPVAELRREALAAQPPVEPGPFRPVDLVELVALDPTIRLDIRYATPDNFLSTAVYEEARAFLQPT